MEHVLDILRIAFYAGIAALLFSLCVISFRQQRTIHSYEAQLQAYEAQDLTRSDIDLYSKTFVTGSQVAAAIRKFSDLGYICKIDGNNMAVQNIDSVLDGKFDSIYYSEINTDAKTVSFELKTGYQSSANLSYNSNSESVSDIKRDIIDDAIKPFLNYYNADARKREYINSNYKELYTVLYNYNTGGDSYLWGVNNPVNVNTVFATSYDPATATWSYSRSDLKLDNYHDLVVLAFSALMQNIDEGYDRIYNTP